MTPPRVRALAVAVSLLLVADVATLLVKVRSADDAGEQLAAAARATTARGSARITLAMRLAFSDRTESTGTGTGVVDFRVRRTSAEVAGPPPTRRIRFVADGETLYDWYESDPKPWARGTPAPGTLVHMGGRVGSFDVLAALRVLGRDVASTVRIDGREQVGGFRTTRYVATFADPVGVDGSFVDARAVVWVSDDHLVRRLELSSALGDSLDFRGSTTFDLHDFGMPVRIDLPPPDEVDPER